MRLTRARRSALAVWLALACAALVAWLCAAPGPGAAQAEAGTAMTLPAPPETPLSEAPASATASSEPAPDSTATGAVTATTDPPPSETPPGAGTPDGASPTPTETLPDAPTPTPSATEAGSATPEASAVAGTPPDTPAATPAETLTGSPTPFFTHTPTPSPTPSLRPAVPAFAGAVLINEVVTDPQSDWSGGGYASPPGAGPVSETDAFVELYITATGLNLAGWTIALDDGTPFSGDLTSSGAFNTARYAGLGSPAHTFAGDYLVLGSPDGAINNTVLISLRDEHGLLVDQVQVGAGGAPEGAASGPDDESVARFPNGLDTGDDAGDFTQQAATPGYANLPGPPAPTATAIAHPPLAVVINEIAWAGTQAGSSDEWLELHNPGSAAINLAGWTLSDGGDLAINFPVLVIAPGGYLLLERSSDATVSDLPADLIYTGSLNDGGEALTLRDAHGSVIDTANQGGGPWPAGGGAERASLERRSAAADSPGNWQTHSGLSQAGSDAAGQPLRGTARAPNSPALPPPPPVPGGTLVLINEFVARPGPGGQEFIEVINLTGAAVDLSGWQLDDAPGGSGPYSLPAGTTLGPGALLVFDQAASGLALNDDGDTVRLLHPDGTPADAWSYASATEGVSWSRLPDGGAWSNNGEPSPGQPNRARPGPPDPDAEAIAALRGWGDGAWVTVAAWVSVPPGVFGPRTIQVQDGTGGVTVYLGRDDWPPLVVGQPVRLVHGYLRRRGGNLQLYVRNAWHVRPGPAADALPPAPWPATTGAAAGGGPNAGALVVVAGRVVRLESQALWLDDGSGPLRVFFPAVAGVPRPPARLGQTWRVTGVVVETEPFSETNPRFRVQPRFAGDLAQMVDGGAVPYVAAPAATPVEAPEPTATAEL